MLGSIEEFRKIHIDAPGMAPPDDPLHSLHGSVGGSAGAKAETRLGESRVENRLQDLTDGLVDKAIVFEKEPVLETLAAAPRETDDILAGVRPLMVDV